MTARLVVVEGIMGSGKSTLSRFLARQLLLSGMRVVHVPESARPHPTNVVRLPHEPPVWEELDAVGVAARSVRRWRGFVRRLGPASPVHVLDGHLLHWDFTALMLSDAPPSLLRRYARGVFSVLQGVDPAIVHLHQADPRPALRRVADMRGREWIRRQMVAKLEAPYPRRKGYDGLEGWLELSLDVCAWANELLPAAGLRVLSLDTTAGRWRHHQRRAAAFAEIPGKWDWRFEAVLWKRRAVERARLAATHLTRGKP